MLTESSKKDINKISQEILKQSKSYDVFPTPVDKILVYTELKAEREIDLSRVEKGFFQKLKDESVEKFKILQSGLSKVKGFFDRREKTIYVDLNQSGGRQNFVKLHEIGHGVLPWQNEVILASDNDETLLETFEDQFEAEANYFATVTLFQHDRFVEDVSRLPLNLSAAMHLSKKYGSSVHSALRNFVIKSNNKCALLVLNPIIGSKGNQALCVRRDLFYSKSFLLEIGEIDFPDKFGFKWDFVRDFKFKKRFNDKGTLNLQTINNEELNASYHYFYNTYNIFVFIFPKGEINKTRTRIILQNA